MSHRYNGIGGSTFVSNGITIFGATTPLPAADAAPVLPPLRSISMVPQMAFASAAPAAETKVLAPPVLPPTASTVSAPAPASMESVAPAVPLMTILPIVPQIALPLATTVPVLPPIIHQPSIA
jgi:hypothetical protein